MKQNFNDLNPDELIVKRDELVEKRRNLQFEMVMGHVDNPMEKRITRRKIARLNTMIHEYKTGLRQV